MLDWLYEIPLWVMWLVSIALIFGSAKLGARFGRRARERGEGDSDLGTLTGAALGLLALLVGFSFSLALARHDARRLLVVEEANAIGSTANFALMLPDPAQRPILEALREYTTVRLSFGVPFGGEKLDRDIARSLELQATLWQQAVAVTKAEPPQSLAVHRFVSSLNEVNNIHERRLTGLLYRVPPILMAMLIAIAMVAMGFTGLHIGSSGAPRPIAMLLMSITVSFVITLIADLDRPTRGLINVPVQALQDALNGLPR
jgi:hypothetical protein